ncbi:MAG: hypothetical protein HGB05_16400, partial [Chloroflexi bacterium]|nr:hypothetical protein [Chloroflexota bacterium]
MSEAGVYYPPETRVLPLTTIRRERVLPMSGKVLVNPGDRVQPAQPVAQAEVSGEVSVVNVAHLLRVAPARAYKYIKVKPKLGPDGPDIGPLIGPQALDRSANVCGP